jgi:PIN domain nuclease of toxin-antitoxin system
VGWIVEGPKARLVNVHQVKTHLSQLLQDVQRGEEVVIANDDKHRDPFDRLLLCQSRVEPMLLLSGDKQLRRYGATVQVFQ